MRSGLSTQAISCATFRGKGTVLHGFGDAEEGDTGHRCPRRFGRAQQGRRRNQLQADPAHVPAACLVLAAFAAVLLCKTTSSFYLLCHFLGS